MPSRAHAAGFTIIELMVVVGIVGVLSLFALPAMRDLVVTNRMKTLSLDLYTSLALARSEAVKRNSGNISMVAAAGGWQFGWTVCFDANGDGDCNDTAAVPPDVVLIAGDAVDSSLALANPAGNIVTYNRDGRLSAATPLASFRITAGANNAQVQMRCVDVSVSGRPNTRADTNATDGDGCN